MIATLTLVVAQDCTVAELSTISSIYSSAIGGSCPNTTAITGSGNYCSDVDCVNFMSDMLGKLPNCSTDGINVKERVQAVVDFCDTGSVDRPDATDSVMMSSLSGSAAPTVDNTHSSNQVTNDITPSTPDDSLTSSSTSSVGFAISTAAFAATALLAGL
ncbi:unnamed protein product [Peronospora destructor]|uniref:Elicitin-like protein n=1 Tax=Peronospora destructor TaxID=86335 RepID=A0AAV0U7V2_9STRA|nr:unnamed protein product [Peronospora destructor]